MTLGEMGRKKVTLGETGRKRDEPGRDGEKERRPFYSCLPAWLVHRSADPIAAVASKASATYSLFVLGSEQKLKMRYPIFK